MLWTKEKNISLWQRTPLPHFPSLDSDRQADVCVIGAGMAGLSTAYDLTKRGLRVVVLESDLICAGQTNRTTAHLSHHMDSTYRELISVHGKDIARVVAASQAAAIQQIETVSLEEEIDCDFLRVPGYLFQGKDTSTDDIEKEYEAALESGVPGIERVSAVPGLSDCSVGIRFALDAQFHPLKYLNGLADAITARGGRIYTHTHVLAVEAESDGSIRVDTRAGFRVRCGSAVVATNSPVNNRFGLHTKQAPYRTYVVGFEVSDDFPLALLWDTEEPFHYVRRQGSTLLVGGEDHKTGQDDDPEACFLRLEDWTREKFPQIGAKSHQWSGQVMETIDGLPFIGKNPHDSSHVFVVTGDCGQGITYGAMAGLILPDLVQGFSHPWSDAYDPSRLRLKSLGTFAQENANVAVQYGDWIKPSQISNLEELPCDCGAVIQDGMKKIAVYKDDDGEVHRVSAVCPHLGGIVAWNSAESTWDCPCHGSRFDRLGHVIEGPAVADLQPMDDVPLTPTREPVHPTPERRPPLPGVPAFRDGATNGS